MRFGKKKITLKFWLGNGQALLETLTALKCSALHCTALLLYFRPDSRFCRGDLPES